QLNEIQVGLDLGDLQALTLVFAEVIAKGFEDPVVDYIISGLRSMTVFDLVDAVRFQSGNLSRGQYARELARRFYDAATHGRRRWRSWLDVGCDGVADVKD